MFVQRMWRGRKGREVAAVAYEKRERRRQKIRTRVYDLLQRANLATKETVEILVRTRLLKEVHAPRGLPPSETIRVLKNLKQRMDTEVKSRVALEEQIVSLKHQWDRDERDRLAEMAKYEDEDEAKEKCPEQVRFRRRRLYRVCGEKIELAIKTWLRFKLAAKLHGIGLGDSPETDRRLGFILSLSSVVGGSSWKSQDTKREREWVCTRYLNQFKKYAVIHGEFDPYNGNIRGLATAWFLPTDTSEMRSITCDIWSQNEIPVSSHVTILFRDGRTYSGPYVLSLSLFLSYFLHMSHA